jgi:hypothetical protein
MHQSHCSIPAQRMRLASCMLAHEGKYGMVSQLSREHDISRQSLYTLRSKGRKGMESVFYPKDCLTVEGVQIRRAVLKLLTDGHASREGIQQCIEEMLGVHVSLGAISAIIHEAGKRAQEWLDQHIPEGMRALVFDEQYSSQRGKAYLNIVDAHSSYVLVSAPPVAVDGESWSILFLILQGQGVKWNIAVSDGGKAIGEAVREITPECVHQRDVWHVLHECQKVQGRVVRATLDLHEQTPKVEQQAKRIAAGKKPLGRNPKTDVAAHAKDVQQMEYLATSLQYLTHELKHLLEIVVLEGQSIFSSGERQEELDALLTLFSELCEMAPSSIKKEIEKLVRHVQGALPHLIVFCQPLDQVQQLACEQLGEAAVHLIGWAWLRRAILGPKTKQLVADFPPAWQPMVAQLFAAWNEAVRSSSAVENWHSILRPFIAVHRHLCADLLAILAVWHNHRVAPRGLHQGQSPLMRAGFVQEPTDWLVALGYSHLASPSAGQGQSSIVPCEPEMGSIAA